MSETNGSRRPSLLYSNSSRMTRIESLPLFGAVAGTGLPATDGAPCCLIVVSMFRLIGSDSAAGFSTVLVAGAVLDAGASTAFVAGVSTGFVACTAALLDDACELFGVLLTGTDGPAAIVARC